MKGRLDAGPSVSPLPRPGLRLAASEFVLSGIGEQSRGVEASEASPIRRVKVWTLVLILHIASPNFAIDCLAWGFSTEYDDSFRPIQEFVGGALTNCGGSAGLAVPVAGTVDSRSRRGAIAARRALT